MDVIDAVKIKSPPEPTLPVLPPLPKSSRFAILVLVYPTWHLKRLSFRSREEENLTPRINLLHKTTLPVVLPECP
jgi:hypothetical protein